MFKIPDFSLDTTSNILLMAEHLYNNDKDETILIVREEQPIMICH